ncbi:hypothetical protein SRB521_00216 [Intestinimonas butyriciproducens]|nr:hypothetical protein SRB521_00216 [Intestinimonas butyriciproducens]
MPRDGGAYGLLHTKNTAPGVETSRHAGTRTNAVCSLCYRWSF